MKAQDDDGLDRIDARMFFSLVADRLDERDFRVVAAAASAASRGKVDGIARSLTGVSRRALATTRSALIARKSGQRTGMIV